MTRSGHFFMTAVAMSVLALSACTKDKNKDEPVVAAGISANVGGTATSFSTGAKAVKSNTRDGVPVTPVTVITGATASGSTITLSLQASLVAGKTYTITDSRPEADILLQTPDGQFSTDLNSITNPVSITITTVSTTTITGTFKGDLISFPGDPNRPDQSVKKVLTEGKFNVSF